MLGQSPIPEEEWAVASDSSQSYVSSAPLQALGCVLYACLILGRLCVPVFANMSQEPFSTRALVLSIMHATLPGIPTGGRAGSWAAPLEEA